DRELPINRRPDRRRWSIRMRSQQRCVVSGVDEARSKDVQVAGADQRLDLVEARAGSSQRDLKPERRSVGIRHWQAAHRVVEQQLPHAESRRQRYAVQLTDQRLEIAVWSSCESPEVVDR